MGLLFGCLDNLWFWVVVGLVRWVSSVVFGWIFWFRLGLVLVEFGVAYVFGWVDVWGGLVLVNLLV